MDIPSWLVTIFIIRLNWEMKHMRSVFYDLKYAVEKTWSKIIVKGMEPKDVYQLSDCFSSFVGIEFLEYIFHLIGLVMLQFFEILFPVESNENETYFERLLNNFISYLIIKVFTCFFQKTVTVNINSQSDR